MSYTEWGIDETRGCQWLKYKRKCVCDNNPERGAGRWSTSWVPSGMWMTRMYQSISHHTDGMILIFANENDFDWWIWFHTDRDYFSLLLNERRRKAWYFLLYVPTCMVRACLRLTTKTTRKSKQGERFHWLRRSLRVDVFAISWSLGLCCRTPVSQSKVMTAAAFWQLRWCRSALGTLHQRESTRTSNTSMTSFFQIQSRFETSIQSRTWLHFFFKNIRRLLVWYSRVPYHTIPLALLLL